LTSEAGFIILTDVKNNNEFVFRLELQKKTGEHRNG
jgi:hypothetical protein